MNALRFLIVIAVASSVGCATVHKSDGKYADIMDNGQVAGNSERQASDGIRVSVSKDDTLSSMHMPYLEFTFENVSNDFLEATDVFIDFGSPDLNKEISIVSGTKLATWWEGVRNKLSMEEWNRALALSAIAIGGAAVSAFSNDQTTRMVGAGVAVGAASVMTIDSFNEARRRVMSVSKESSDIKMLRAMFPETHLFGGAVVPPPKLFLRRWVVFHSTSPGAFEKVQYIYVNYKVKGGVRQLRVPTVFRGSR